MLSYKKEGLGWRNLSLSSIQDLMDIMNFLEFLESLTESDSDKMFSLIHKIQDSGLLVAQYMQWVKKVDKNLYEIRLKCPNSIQRALYFHVINNRYIITHGFTKKTQKTPKREIIHAKQIRREFEEEYYANN